MTDTVVTIATEGAATGTPFHKSIALTRLIAIVLFGLLLPLFIALRVDVRIESAEKFVTQAASDSFIISQFEKSPEKFKTPNDYALVALADSERANLAVMLNKQVMKLVVVYMGFAVMSFAMMFIVLGFTDAPVKASGSGAGFSLDLQFGSIGAAVFVLGAAMAAGGGLLRNEFRTVGLPKFAGSSGPSAPQLAGSLADEPSAAQLAGPLAEIVQGCSFMPAEVDQAQCLALTATAHFEKMEKDR